ncbi:MAG: hypothetical protein N2999_01705 [Proteobacteria bacterium]|nr:hypothetical protein [Pseudomonadota bacterium]
MKKTLTIFVVFCALFTTSAIAEPLEELINLGREIGKLEREIPFFTKSKVTIFFSYDSKKFNNVFYGLYLNDNLIRTGDFQIKEDKLKTQFIGDFPVRTGANTVTIRMFKDNREISKKFQFDVPEYRRVAVEFLFSDSFEKLRVVPNAWLID